MLHALHLLQGYQEEEAVNEVEYLRGEGLNEMVLSDVGVICCNKLLVLSGTKAVHVE